jgi:hypothetical protein
MEPTHLAELGALCDELMRDYKRHARRKNCIYKTTGKVAYDEYFPRHSKYVMDRIDEVLAKHFRFSADEQDYLVNYDIKYRVNADGADEDTE